ncbi:MAG: hypothetical protein MI741_23975, partial [Rhodospirillales bacterium]|nr:hypothetical protein [Rhodospirillales bacterium]
EQGDGDQNLVRHDPEDALRVGAEETGIESAAKCPDSRKKKSASGKSEGDRVSGYQYAASSREHQKSQDFRAAECHVTEFL